MIRNRSWRMFAGVSAAVVTTGILTLYVLPNAKYAYLCRRMLDLAVKAESAGYASDDWLAYLELRERLARRAPQLREGLAADLSIQAMRTAREGDFANARRLSDLAIGAKPDRPSVYSSYAKVLLLDGEWRTAEYMLTRAAYWRSWLDTKGHPLSYTLDYNSQTLYLGIAEAAFRDQDSAAAARNFFAYKLLTVEAQQDTSQGAWLRQTPRKQAEVMTSELHVTCTAEETDALAKSLEQVRTIPWVIPRFITVPLPEE